MSVRGIDLVVLRSEVAACGDKFNVIVCIVILLKLDWSQLETG
jgi:hypothetical protein